MSPLAACRGEQRKRAQQNSAPNTSSRREEGAFFFSRRARLSAAVVVVLPLGVGVVVPALAGVGHELPVPLPQQVLEIPGVLLPLLRRRNDGSDEVPPLLAQRLDLLLAAVGEHHRGQPERLLDGLERVGAAAEGAVDEDEVEVARRLGRHRHLQQLQVPALLRVERLPLHLINDPLHGPRPARHHQHARAVVLVVRRDAAVVLVAVALAFALAVLVLLLAFLLQRVELLVVPRLRGKNGGERGQQ